ncbi:MAG: dihydropteroate synthase [Deltaproteobacteria bacterium]|nr:dihydropteroate synthase [Deltaproteobacteria bacterium]
MRRVGVDKVGAALMASKQLHYNIKVTGLTPAQANILKQEVLSIGAEAAVSKGVISCAVKETDAIISGTKRQLARLIEKLKAQPYKLKELGSELKDLLHNLEKDGFEFSARERKWKLGSSTLIMGILNVTPDSFSDGGVYSDTQSAIKHALRMVEDGADIIDVGGESTRPGALKVSTEEELKRVIPVVALLKKKGICVSVDTTKSEVAEEALRVGAEIINDVSAMTKDKRMAGVIAKYNAAVILMHMRGEPQEMQDDTDYEDLMGTLHEYLLERVDAAVSAGIDKNSIAIDPGIGFGKSVDGNVEVINRLKELRSIGCPVVLGTSRKSFIGSITGGNNKERLSGTLATVTAGILNGADIVRVHDVREAKEASVVTDAIKSGHGGAGISKLGSEVS